MPLYMDIHTVDSETFSVEDVVKAHMEDLAIQARFGVIQLKYWVNVEAKTLFCLMEGPDREACNQVHVESHGNTACNIIEVSDDEYNLFLGIGKNINDLAQTESGEIDTGYRTILLSNVVDFTGKYKHYTKEIKRLIEKHKGVLIVNPGNDIMASFIFSSNAILCAYAIEKLFKSLTENIEFTLSLATGRPVDEKGDKMFEETKKKVQFLCSLGLNKRMYIDIDTKNLSSKEFKSPKVREEDFRTISADDFNFISQLFGILNEKLVDPDFKSDDLDLALALSKSKVYRKIKALTGMAPNQLIQELRLRKSIELLQQNSHTIAEIAFDSGFNSPTYFTRLFKKRYRLLPTSFTKL
jgi:AraC-like DNA-binding protein